MTYVVEIEDKHGRRAVKEYDATERVNDFDTPGFGV